MWQRDGSALTLQRTILDSFRLPFPGWLASVINRFNWIFQGGPKLPAGMHLHNGLHEFSLS